MARLVRRLTAPIALAGALGLAPACALSLDGPRPERPISERPACDTTKGLVAADGIVGAVVGVSAIGAADESSGAALVLALIGAAFVASAVHGNGVVDECTDASVAWERDYGDKRRPSLVPDEEVASRPPAVTPPSNRLSMRSRPPVVAPQPAIASAPPAPEDAPPPADEPPAPRIVAPAAKTPPPVAKRKDSGEWSSFWEETP